MSKFVSRSSFNPGAITVKNTCSFCNFTTNSDTAAKLHLKFVHKKTIKKNGVAHICGNCSEEFGTVEEVREHNKKHALKTRGKKK